MGRLYVFSAPSGAGKSTIINNLEKGMDSIAYSVSHTTRKPRGREKEGVHYHFVEKDTFNKMIADGQFVEWAEIYDNFYGTSFSSLDEQTSQGLDVLLDLDHQGANNIRRHYEDSVLIYVLPPLLFGARPVREPLQATKSTMASLQPRPPPALTPAIFRSIHLITLPWLKKPLTIFG